ncbi:hypothetical protein SBD_4161 [Streptomyces bottropensis ATCC 25435]|uniref:Uncharacterized protein n=1 Tax=Streptomyces bottropensis ATCC 25435 TaxID=1054862 RepID=M3FQS9_9ACTN|nr:hypothetical protein SBD_4161 [Streptomyces bottropensis ATCC 25435]
MRLGPRFREHGWCRASRPGGRPVGGSRRRVLDRRRGRPGAGLAVGRGPVGIGVVQRLGAPRGRVRGAQGPCRARGRGRGDGGVGRGARGHGGFGLGGSGLGGSPLVGSGLRGRTARLARRTVPARACRSLQFEVAVRVAAHGAGGRR